MTPEITASLVTLAGAILIAAVGQFVATVYFGGRLTERVANHGDRIAALEAAEREDLIRRATAAGKFGSELT
ncbi:MAG: hypothetical protein ACLQHT_13615 [Terracidiphilus sp.]